MQNCDNNFLNSYIHAYAIIASNKASIITRIDSGEIIFASQPLLKLLKLQFADLAGKCIYDALASYRFIHESINLYNKVLADNNPASALIAHDFDNTGTKTVKLLYKEPIISQLTGEIVAIVDEIRDFTINRELAQSISFMNQVAGINTKVDVDQPINLTKRQQEIVFLLSLGKSPKNIAELIGKIGKKALSPATVTAVINKHLYLKFKVNSTSQLIEKAMLLNLVNNIPASFIQQSGMILALD